MEPLDKELLDLSNRDTKQRLYSFIAPLQGLHEITIKPKRETRRVRANRYYFGLVVKPTRQAMNSHGNQLTTLEVHDWIKSKALAKDVVNEHGEVIGSVPLSSHNKDIAEFHAFVIRAKQVVYDWWGVEPPDETEYFAEHTARPAKAGRAA